MKKEENYVIVLIQNGQRIPQIGIPVPSRSKGKATAEYLNRLLPENLREEEHYELQVAKSKYFIKYDRKQKEAEIKKITEDKIRIGVNRYKINGTFYPNVFNSVEDAIKNCIADKIILPNGQSYYK